MCGINTILKKDGVKASVEDIHRMCSAIKHRGPDDAGYALLNQGRLALGHVRLSIIDLHSGDQPLYNEDGSICIVFNGEIYDYKEMREELLKQGHKFRTHTDTEVIVHLYEQHGLDFIHYLNGEFAFAIWDANQRRLIAARDRCGVKPLFYFENGKELLISSEAKGILSLPRIPRALNPDMFTGPLFGSWPRAMSSFEGINTLSPGHFLIVEDGRPSREVPYWKPTFKVDPSISFKDARDQVRDLFTKAVRRRMVADVPVGTYLSGGLDSTLVCGLMAEQTKNFKAFSIGFGKTIYDETDAARQIASHFGAEFEAIDCDDEVLADEFLKTLYHVEQPLANPNAIAKQVLSRLVRSKGYKVCITGEGADEVFGGYAYFKLEKIWRMLLAGGAEAAEGRELMKQFKALEKRSEGVLWHRSSKWKHLPKIFGYPSFNQMRVRQSTTVSGRLLTAELRERARFKTPTDRFNYEFPAEELAQLDPFNATKVMTYNQLVSYIIPTLADRVEMANSVECRTPFLDKDLIEYASTVDPSYFMNIQTLREKHLLRESFKDILPPIVASVHKHPFLSPSWRSVSATRQGREMVESLLSREAIHSTGYFKQFGIQRVKFYWNWLPKSTTLSKRVDVIAGMILSAQAMHRLFVENEIEVDMKMPIRDRSWNSEKQPLREASN